jgi:glycosidase
MVDSHDTTRIQSRVGGNVRLQKLAAVIQHTYPGVPCIFYGDEIGLLGDEANSARRTTPWDESQWDQELRSFYKTLIALRRTSDALAHGGFQLLYTDADTLAFLRDTDDDQVIVVGYRGDDERPAQQLPVRHGGIANGTRFVEVFSAVEVIVAGGALPLPAMQKGAAIWRATSAATTQH